MRPHFTEVVIKCTCGKHLGTLDLEEYPAEFEVELCEDCCENARNDGYSEGWDEGYTSGLEEDR